MSLRALAPLAGVSVSSIAAVEIGTRAGRTLTAETCMRLAKALGVTADELMSLTEDEDKDEEEAPRPAVEAVA